MKTVYLAGPITGQLYEECTNWRDQAAKLLAPEVLSLSPMRHKEYLNNDKPLTAVVQGMHPLSTNQGILTRDYNDVHRSDALLVNMLRATRVSIGTVVEIGWAYHKRTPIVLVMEPGGHNPHEHAFILQMCPFRCTTLEEGVTLIKHILGPFEQVPQIATIH